ncbi:MAG TPA: hypothetical protein VE396_15235 [Xanthobacteraceae bacterium]|nr:hypothetical protein [Xanthobacteraceae bacterium]
MPAETRTRIPPGYYAGADVEVNEDYTPAEIAEAIEMLSFRTRETRHTISIDGEVAKFIVKRLRQPG